MVKLSLFNNTYAPLGIDGFFLGAIESTQQEVSISVNVLADVPVRVIIRQYRSSDVTSLVQENFKDVAADVKEVVQTPVKAQFFNIAVLNESGGTAATITHATTYLQASHYVNLDVRQLSATEKEDSVVCYGVDLATGLKHPLNVDASGSLIIIGGGGGDASQWATFPAVANVDMSGNKIINITELTGVGTYGNPIIVNNNLNFTGDTVFGSGAQLSNLSYIVGNADNGLDINNIANLGGMDGAIFINAAQTTLGGSLKFNNDATIQSTAYQNPFQTNLDMNNYALMNVNGVNGATDSSVVISSDIAVQLTADVNGTPKYASLDTNGVFNAKSFTLYQAEGGGITFPDGSSQTTAFTTALQAITSTDGSITIDYPNAFTANLAVASPYSLPVATTSVLGGVKPDGTTITATAEGVISATSQGITSNTFYVNEGVNSINNVLPLMGGGDICIISAGSFVNTTDIIWNVPQSGLSGSVAPAPLSFLTTANASRFTVTATQVRIANIKYQLPVFLSGNNCQLDNCDFDSTLTIGTGVTGYITIQNCEFVGTQTITVASTFANVCYFINCNFLGSTFVLSQASASQVIFTNCAGFVSYPVNATYVGINTLTAGTAQLSTNSIKSVVTGGNIKIGSQIDMDGFSFINVNNVGGRTGDALNVTNGLEVNGGSLQMRGNNIITVGTITQLLQGITLVSLTPSQVSSRNLYTVSIPFFAGGGSATFVMNDLGVFSTKSVTLTTGGQITYPDTTTQNSGLIKGTATLVGGLHTITDARVTTGAICVVSYADSPPVDGVLCAKVTAGQIVIQSTLLADVSPVFFMYFV